MQLGFNKMKIMNQQKQMLKRCLKSKETISRNREIQMLNSWRHSQLSSKLDVENKVL